MLFHRWWFQMLLFKNLRACQWERVLAGAYQQDDAGDTTVRKLKSSFRQLLRRIDHSVTGTPGMTFERIKPASTPQSPRKATPRTTYQVLSILLPSSYDMRGIIIFKGWDIKTGCRRFIHPAPCWRRVLLVYSLVTCDHASHHFALCSVLSFRCLRRNWTYSWPSHC